MRGENVSLVDEAKVTERFERVQAAAGRGRGDSDSAGHLRERHLGMRFIESSEHGQAACEGLDKLRLPASRRRCLASVRS